MCLIKQNRCFHWGTWFFSVQSLIYFKDCKEVPTITCLTLSELHWTDLRQHSRDESQSLETLKAHLTLGGLTAVTLSIDWAMRHLGSQIRVSQLEMMNFREIYNRREEKKKKKRQNILGWDSKLTNIYVYSEQLLQWELSLCCKLDCRQAL